MNREIKFRAWFKGDIEIKTPLRFDMVVLEEEGELVFQMVKDKEFVYNAVCVFGDTKNWIIDQYTGRKDKNGKEIYEGDILIYCDGRLFKVEWSEKFAGMWALELKDYGNGPHGYGFEETEDCEWEIIGNIYENPELINKI